MIGLYGKYEVTKDGEPVEDCFVLRPERDPAAAIALAVYAEVTDNDQLRADLRAWGDRIRRVHLADLYTEDLWPWGNRSPLADQPIETWTEETDRLTAERKAAYPDDERYSGG